MRHDERHRSNVVGWLRAAVLGANDGIVSTASLLVGIAASGADRQSLVVAGVAALVAGAAAMAAGEYVSVASQADTESADLERESKELAADPAAEHGELAAIYVARGLAPDLADEVARQLMARDCLAAHARDELGSSDQLAARPTQAALASAASFAVVAGWPLLVGVGAGATRQPDGLARRRQPRRAGSAGHPGRLHRPGAQDAVRLADSVVGCWGHVADRRRWSALPRVAGTDKADLFVMFSSAHWWSA